MFKDTQVRIIINIILAVFVLGAICFLTSCNGCKKPAQPIESAVEVIEKATNPAIDSLKQANNILADSVAILKKELDKQKKKTSLAESNATATGKRLKEALNSKDTGGIIVYADDIIEEFHNYIQETNKQDSIQDGIILKQTAAIENSRAEIELHEQKFNLLKTAYQVKEIEANDWKEAANKLDRKLKKKKFWNGVWKVGTVAGAGLAAFIFL